MNGPCSVTALLGEWSRGDHGALDRLLPLVYAELRRMAARQLRSERPNHTLQPTALVHEAYLRLVEQRQVDWQGRAHFFGVAAQAMRRILGRPRPTTHREQARRRGAPRVPRGSARRGVGGAAAARVRRRSPGSIRWTRLSPASSNCVPLAA